jgi:hypothetical protein
MSKKQQNIKYPKEFLEKLQSITSKRPKTVIDHILKHGSITAEDLQDENIYGYTQAARAARDVKECGIPLVGYYTFSERTGKRTYAYKFGNLDEIQTNRVAGRIQFSKDFKRTLYEISGGHCQVCNGVFEERYLQVDHRVPYEVGGDVSDREVQNFMLLCGSCNRAKSWSCEHCENWKFSKSPSLCMACYWGDPNDYNHIALEDVRRLDLHWRGNEVKYYDAIKAIAEKNNFEFPEFIKTIFEEKIKNNS